MSETAENAAASLQIQLETSKKVVEMTAQINTMTDLAMEASRACEIFSDILLTLSAIPTITAQIDEVSDGVQRLEVASRSMHNSYAEHNRGVRFGC